MDNRPDFLVPVFPDCADGGRQDFIESFSRRLSPEHKWEIRDLGSPNPSTALQTSLACSKEAYAFFPQSASTPVFMFGVEEAGSITGAAMVWMLATPEITRHKTATLRSARWGVKRAFTITDAFCLEQYIPQWYHTGLRFVRRLGFFAELFPAPVQTPLVRVTITRAAFEKKEREWAR